MNSKNMSRSNTKSYQPKGGRSAKKAVKNQQRVHMTSAPAAISRSLKTQSPIERSGPLGSRVVKYKEYVQDILGSVAFSAIAFPCNPGLSNLFAWLAGQSLFYQEYTVKKLGFLFETEKPTSAGGKLMLAFLQDSSDPLPASKQEMLENLLKASGAIWEPTRLPISMQNFAALQRSRFVRSGNLAANLDVKTYDIGQLIVATQGCADTTAVGELYIEYEIELRTPIQSISQLSSALAGKIAGVTPSQTSLFGTVPTVTGGVALTAGVNTLTFNVVGQYLLDSNVTGTGLFTSFVPTITGTGAVSGPSGVSNAAANIGTTAQWTTLVNITSRGQTVIIDCSAVSTTITASTTRLGTYGFSLV